MEIVLLIVGLAVGAGAGFLLAERRGLSGVAGAVRAAEAAGAERLEAARAEARADADQVRAERADEVQRLRAEHSEVVSRLQQGLEQVRAQLIEANAQRRSEEQVLEAVMAQNSKVLAEVGDSLVEKSVEKYQQLDQAAINNFRQHGQTVTQYLDAIAKRVNDIEAERKADSAGLQTSVKQLTESSQLMAGQAQQLTHVLRDSRVRGNWGEVQLQRLLELTGMLANCDYVEQKGSWSGEGNGRPDVVVHLPGNRNVAIDAKVPFDRFLDAANAEDHDERARLHQEHGQHVMKHVTALSKRDYTKLVDGSVDLVVMFVPSDAILAAAYEGAPGLFESAAKQRVILASPSSLMGILKAMSLTWQEHRLAEEAVQIADLGRELLSRLSVFSDHHGKIGANLERAVKAYNASVGSLESRCLPTARKLGAMVGSDDPAEIKRVDEAVREPVISETDRESDVREIVAETRRPSRRNDVWSTQPTLELVDPDAPDSAAV